MITEETDKRYCQSCGMPLRFDVEEYLGTNSDGSRSNEFCYYCLKNGEYIVDIPMSEMVDIWVKYNDKYNEYSGTDYAPHELRTILNKRLPTLSRWRQKQETKFIHYQITQKIISHINENLFKELDIDALASMSGLSKFHFRRVFKSVTGENIASYIQRLRIEQVAHLLLSTDSKLEQIANQTNYSTKYSLAKAFHKHFGISSSEYRKRYTKKTVDGETDTSPEIQFFTNINIHCLEVGDAYLDKSKYKYKWDRISGYTNQNKLNGSYGKYVSVSLDDPLITPTDKCRFYLGVTVPDGMKPKTGFVSLSIPDGRYAIFKHKGKYNSLHKLYKSIYEIWLPQSGYCPRGTVTFEIYQNTPENTTLSGLRTDIYIPIEKQSNTI